MLGWSLRRSQLLTRIVGIGCCCIGRYFRGGPYHCRDLPHPMRVRQTRGHLGPGCLCRPYLFLLRAGRILAYSPGWDLRNSWIYEVVTSVWPNTVELVVLLFVVFPFAGTRVRWLHRGFLVLHEVAGGSELF